MDRGCPVEEGRAGPLVARNGNRGPPAGGGLGSRPPLLKVPALLPGKKSPGGAYFAWLSAKAAVTFGVGAQCPQEVHLAEGGPVRVAEIELRVCRLPQKEPPQPLLSAGADHQVRVGLARRVEVLGYVLDVEDLGQLLDRGAPAR